MVVQQNRKSPSTVLTAHNSTGNRTSMCNTTIFKDWQNVRVIILFHSFHVNIFGKQFEQGDSARNDKTNDVNLFVPS